MMEQIIRIATDKWIRTIDGEDYPEHYVLYFDRDHYELWRELGQSGGGCATGWEMRAPRANERAAARAIDLTMKLGRVVEYAERCEQRAS